ncbi:lamin tail domain-containing protein [Candidatus Uhrbacteria bacterium]|nr:lamin tail domain-containing protein [Candidatus Uhrbacteria bacterium]
MKRFLSLSLIVASLFGFGLNARAATEPPQATVVFTSTTEYSQEQILICVSNDPETDPILKTILSSFSYAQIPENIFAFLSQKPVQPNQDIASALQSGGTSGTGTVDNTGTSTGTGSGLETPQPAQTISSSTQVTTQTIQTNQEPIQNVLQPTPTTSIPTQTITQITTSAVQPAQAVSQPTPKTLKITSLYPNTTGNDAEEEFITIANTGTQDVNLKDWSLKDASGKTFKFETDFLLGPGLQTELKRTQTNIALNNDKDEISLFTPDNSLIDNVIYENAPNGEVYKWTNGVWSWPPKALIIETVTPNLEPNVQSNPNPEVVFTLPDPINTQTVEIETQPEPTTLRISALYPNTIGNDADEEYIEIKNTGTQDVNLKNWSLKDASGKTYVFADDLVLAPNYQTEVKRAQTNITLNNDTEEISLFAPNDSLIDNVIYESAPNGEVYKWIDGVWVWSSETSTNEPETVSTTQTTIAETKSTNQSNPANTSSSETTAPSNQTQQYLTISQAKNLPDLATIQISGTVNVLPGILGKQFFYIQDNESGIQVYKYDALFPELKVGQKIVVSGEMSTNGTERRVKITKTGIIEPTSETVVLEPKNSEMAELKTEDTGELFTVIGIVKSVSADKLQIEKDGLTLDVAIAVQSGIDTTTLMPGTSLKVSGIVRPTTGGLKLSPRSQDDLVVLSSPVDPLVAGTLDSGKNAQNKSDQNMALLLTASSGIVMVAFVVRHLIRKQKITYATDHHIELTTENVN